MREGKKDTLNPEPYTLNPAEPLGLPCGFVSQDVIFLFEYCPRLSRKRANLLRKAGDVSAGISTQAWVHQSSASGKVDCGSGPAIACCESQG